MAPVGGAFVAVAQLAQSSVAGSRQMANLKGFLLAELVRGELQGLLALSRPGCQLGEQCGIGCTLLGPERADFGAAGGGALLAGALAGAVAGCGGACGLSKPTKKYWYPRRMTKEMRMARKAL